MLATTVIVVALSLEMGFTSSISPSMEIAEARGMFLAKEQGFTFL
jgi:hypothetical protein